MAIQLGSTPLEFVVVLPRDADFTTALVSDEDWPAGITIEMAFFDTLANVEDEQPAITWTATITGPTAQWDEDLDAVQAVLDAEAAIVRVYYHDGTKKLLWGRGKTKVV